MSERYVALEGHLVEHELFNTNDEDLAIAFAEDHAKEHPLGKRDYLVIRIIDTVTNTVIWSSTDR